MARLYSTILSYMYTHPGTEVSRIQSHPLENMICLAASKLTSLQSLSSTSLLNSLVDGKLGEVLPGWCQLSDENPFSPGHLPHPHSTAHFYQALSPRSRWCFHSTLFLTPEALFEVDEKLRRLQARSGLNYFNYVIAITSWASDRVNLVNP